jgi:DNA-binding NarL/FixJ family response regulator
MQSQVIICDQQPVYALGSSMLIHQHPEYLKANIINDFNMLNEVMIQTMPRVVVVESSMFKKSQSQNIELQGLLKKKIPVMIVLNEQDEFVLHELIGYGFSVIVSRNVTKEEWLKGLEMARKDKVYFSNDIAHKISLLIHKEEDVQLVDKVYQLSLYDKYILIRICQEAPSKLIAFELGHSKRTVEGHRTKMMQLFDVKNVAGLVKVAFTSKLYNHYLSNPGLYDFTLCAKTSSL